MATSTNASTSGTVQCTAYTPISNSYLPTTSTNASTSGTVHPHAQLISSYHVNQR